MRLTEHYDKLFYYWCCKDYRCIFFVVSPEIFNSNLLSDPTLPYPTIEEMVHCETTVDTQFIMIDNSIIDRLSCVCTQEYYEDWVKRNPNEKHILIKV